MPVGVEGKPLKDLILLTACNSAIEESAGFIVDMAGIRTYNKRVLDLFFSVP